MLQHVFAYLNLMRSTLPQHWSFLESSTLGQISWRWKEHGQPGPAAKNLATRLHSLYDREQILAGPYYATDFEPQHITEYLALLIPDRCRVFVGSKEQLVGGSPWDQTEHYYGTEYCVGPLTGVTNVVRLLCATLCMVLNPMTYAAVTYGARPRAATAEPVRPGPTRPGSALPGRRGKASRFSPL